MVEENLDPTGIQSPDRPAHSESLYRLSYTGPHWIDGYYPFVFFLFFYILQTLRDGVKREWRKLHNEELNDLYCSLNIVQVIISRLR